MRKHLVGIAGALTIAVVAVLGVTAPSTAAPAPVRTGIAAPHHRPALDQSIIPGQPWRWCVSTSYRARVWHAHPTRPGEECLLKFGWYPASWRMTGVWQYGHHVYLSLQRPVVVHGRDTYPATATGAPAA